MNDAMDAVLQVKSLKKTFHVGFLRKRVDAVRGIDFEVRRGETFGLLGPNGAGKTTTIKMLLRLVYPSSGSILRFGQPGFQRRAMGRIGYMPENPYVYQHLRPLEFLDFCGRLTGLGRTERRQRAEELIERVGLRHALGRPIGRFSKGMMQRIGLAQALLHDPEVLILDEPMSGLDPVGRREIRELLIELRSKGKTLIFTSHILTDVESICDRVVIMKQGQIVASGTLDTLLSPESRRFDVEVQGLRGDAQQALESLALRIDARKNACMVHLEGDETLKKALDLIHTSGAELISLHPHRASLEDIFLGLDG